MMKKVKLAAVLLCLILLGTGNLMAEKKWTLRECIEYAIENNISVKQQELDVKGSDIQLNTAINSRLPNLSVSGTQNFSIARGQFQNSPGVYEYYDMTSASSSVSANSSLQIFAGMRIHNQIKEGKLNLLAITESLSKTKENLELSVASLYLEALFRKEMVEIYKEQKRLSELLVERTEALVHSGSAPLAQIYEVKAQLAKDELSVVTSKNDMETALLDLAQVLNLKDEQFNIVEPTEELSLPFVLGSVLLSPDEIYYNAIEVKPHIKEAVYRVESSEIGLKIAKASFWPTLNVGLSYNNGFNKVFSDNYVNDPFSRQIRDNQRGSIGFNLNIPIFNRMATRNQVRSARLDIQRQELALEDVKQQMYKEIRKAHQSATAARSQFLSTEKAYQAATESHRYAQERYDVGKMSVYDFSESQTNMMVSRSEQLRAKYEFLFRSKILDFYRGIEITID